MCSYIQIVTNIFCRVARNVLFICIKYAMDGKGFHVLVSTSKYCICVEGRMAEKNLKPD